MLNEDSSRLADDYKKWLNAFLDIWPRQPSLAAERIQDEQARLNGLRRRVDLPHQLRPKPDAIKKWAVRGSLPSYQPWRQALVSSVQKELSSPPGGLVTEFSFEELVEKLSASRASFEAGHAKLQQVDALLFDCDAVAIRPKLVSQLDLASLGLGTEENGGEVPTYVKRTAHLEIVQRLDSSSLFLITGASKAGKTRSLLECLSDSKHSRSKVYWVSRTPGAVGELVRQLTKAPKEPRVFVFDSLESFDFESSLSGMNRLNIRRLSELGKIVGTLDERVADSWLNRFGGFRHSTYSTSDLPLELMLIDGSLRLQGKLDQIELEQALQVAGQNYPVDEVEYFGVLCSRGHLLRQKFNELKAGTPMEKSLSDAAIDAYILSNSGAEIPLLADLTARRLKAANPNALFSQASFELALEKFTAPISPGSLQSVLQRTSEGTDLFRLSDYVWEVAVEYGVESSNITGLEVDFTSAIRVSLDFELWHVALVLVECLLERDEGNADSLTLAAEVHLALENLGISENLARQALDINPKSTSSYSVLARVMKKKGDDDGAIEILREGSLKSIDPSDLNLELANLLSLRGDPEALVLVDDLWGSNSISEFDRLVVTTTQLLVTGNLRRASSGLEEALGRAESFSANELKFLSAALISALGEGNLDRQFALREDYELEREKQDFFLHVLGELKLKEAKYEDAELLLSQVRDPITAQVTAPLLALAIFKQGRKSEALAYLDEFLKEGDPIGAGVLGLINLGIGLISVDIDELEKAELALEAALNCNDHLNIALYWLGIVQTRLGNLDAAILSLTKCSLAEHDLRITSKIMLADAYSMKAVTANAKGIYEEVLSDAAWADFVTPIVKNLTLEAYARLLFEDGQFSANLSFITDQLDAETSYELMRYLGLASQLSGCEAECEKALETLALDYPGSKVSLLARYLISDEAQASQLLIEVENFLSHSDSQEILAIWSEMRLDLDASYSDLVSRLAERWFPEGDAASIRVGSMLYLARRLADKGDAAADVIQRLIDSRGSQLAVSTCPARYLYEVGQCEFARDIAEAFISRNDADFWSHHFLGLSQLETEDQSMGIESLRRASVLTPNSFGFLESYVRAELAFGDPQRAHRELGERIDSESLRAEVNPRVRELLEVVEERLKSEA